MARRREGLLDLLVWFPWWVSVFLAAASWVAIVFLAPGAVREFPVAGQQLGQAMERIGWLPATALAGVFLVCAWVSRRQSRRKRGLLDTRTGTASIRSLSWREFEELVAEAFRREGYRVEENAKAGSDGGVDIRLLRNGELVLVQCKNWNRNRVGVGVVREMCGVMMDEGAAGVVIVCSGRFTRDAWNFAKGKPVRLVGGRALMEMIEGVRRSP